MADTNSTQIEPVFGPKDTQIPFDAELRIVVSESQGRRWVSQRSGQLTAKMIEDDLVDAGWVIATPIPYIPAFGSHTAKIKIRGFFRRDVGSDPSDDLSNFKPADPIRRIHSGTVPGEKTGVIIGDGGGGNLAYGQDPVAQTDTLVYELMNSLETTSDLIGTTAIIEKVDLMGVYYGKGARSFPD